MAFRKDKARKQVDDLTHLRCDIRLTGVLANDDRLWDKEKDVPKVSAEEFAAVMMLTRALLEQGGLLMEAVKAAEDAAYENTFNEGSYRNMMMAAGDRGILDIADAVDARTGDGSAVIDAAGRVASSDFSGISDKEGAVAKMLSNLLKGKATDEEIGALAKRVLVMKGDM